MSEVLSPILGRGSAGTLATSQEIQHGAMVRVAVHQLRQILRQGALHPGDRGRSGLRGTGTCRRPRQADPGHRLWHGAARHRTCQARLPRDRLRSLRGPASPRPRKGGGGRRDRRFSMSGRDSAALHSGIRCGHHVLRRRVSVDGDRREELRHSHPRCGGVASRRQIAADNAQRIVPAVSLGQGLSRRRWFPNGHQQA